MKWKFLSIGLLLTCAGSDSIAQSILNQTIRQEDANFNIGGEGTAYRFTSVPAYNATAVDFINWTLSRTLSSGAASRRWTMGFTGQETGGNTGSDFAIWSYEGATILQRPFTIRRENGNVGIGMSSPAYKLHVAGGDIMVSPPSDVNGGISIGNGPTNRWAWSRLTATDPNAPHGLVLYEDNSSIGGSVGTRLWVTRGGAVGIGDQAPQAPFQIKSGGQIFKFIAGANTSSYTITQSVNDDGMNFSLNSNIRGFNFVTTRGKLFTIDSVGNVRIGSNVPSTYKLAVNGSAIFTKVVVKTYANWPDFVFEKDYKLQPIEEVISFVKEHKHLPGIPSAKEVAENGQDVGEMNAKLLQKIEELTLYIADMKKEIDALKAEKK